MGLEVARTKSTHRRNHYRSTAGLGNEIRHAQPGSSRIHKEIAGFSGDGKFHATVQRTAMAPPAGKDGSSSSHSEDRLIIQRGHASRPARGISGVLSRLSAKRGTSQAMRPFRTVRPKRGRR